MIVAMHRSDALGGLFDPLQALDLVEHRQHGRRVEGGEKLCVSVAVIHRAHVTSRFVDGCYNATNATVHLKDQPLVPAAAFWNDNNSLPRRRRLRNPTQLPQPIRCHLTHAPLAALPTSPSAPTVHRA